MTIAAASAAMSLATACGSVAAWCSDADTRDNVLARRNVLAGLWAGRQMQIPDQMVQGYAAAIHHASLRERGEEEVVEKLFSDLDRCGIAVTREEVRRKLSEFHRQAIAQTRETD